MYIAIVILIGIVVVTVYACLSVSSRESRKEEHERKVIYMDWKKEAIDKLRQYTAKKASIKNIPEEIARLELAIQNIRSAVADGTPVQGGGSGREDVMLSNIVERQELHRNLEQAKRWVQEVDDAWSVLTDEERLMLDRFYIHSERGVAERLAEDLGFDVKTVYRRKDAAIRRFTIALYGFIES